MKNYAIRPTPVAGGFYCALDGYLYSGELADPRSYYDYSDVELITMHALDKQQAWQNIPYPSTPRWPAEGRQDRSDVRKELRDRHPSQDPDDWKPEYTRRLTIQGETDKRLAYGISRVTNPREKAFVIIEQ